MDARAPPLLIGAVHGLAGSGALTALVLATLPTTASRLAYMTLFGLGSTIGMAVLSGLLGWPLARLGAHHLVARPVALAVGGVSTIWAWPGAMPPIARLLCNDELETANDSSRTDKRFKFRACRVSS